MKHITFDEYLNEKCAEKGGFDGVLDDDYEDAFESWLETVDPAFLIQWGNEYGEFLAMKNEPKLI